MRGEVRQDRGWVPDLIPARMLNEFAYCPRLCYIEWVQGEFVDSVDTVDGRFQHRRVDLEAGVMPTDDEIHETFHAESVYLSGPEVGITCRIDLRERGRRSRRWTTRELAMCLRALEPEEYGSAWGWF